MNNNIPNTDKAELVARLIDRPDTFSDDEIRQMLDDSECRALYDTAVQTAQALEAPIEADINAEWARLSMRLNRRRAIPQWWKVAAMITVILLSGIAYAAIRQSLQIKQENPKQEVTATVQPPKQADKQVTTDSVVTPAAVVPLTPHTFENTPLDELVSVIAGHYGLNVTTDGDEAHQLRLYYEWNPALLVEQVVEQLNTFEKVNITLINNTLIIE